jgi:hypothetical protein
MSRNRKNQSVASRFGPALKAFVLCVLIAGAGLGYVALTEQILKLSSQIKEKELALEGQRSLNIRMARQMEELRSPRTLDARVRELTPGLGVPQPDQVVRLVETHSRPPVLAAAKPVAQPVGRSEVVR